MKKCTDVLVDKHSEFIYSFRDNVLTNLGSRFCEAVSRTIYMTTSFFGKRYLIPSDVLVLHRRNIPGYWVDL